MSPIGGFTSAILGTLLGGRNKSTGGGGGGGGSGRKYEKLETDDPERKRQEATHDEIQRLHFKIVSQSVSQSTANSSEAAESIAAASRKLRALMFEMPALNW